MSEKVSEQPNMMVYGHLKPYQVQLVVSVYYLFQVLIEHICGCLLYESLYSKKDLVFIYLIDERFGMVGVIVQQSSERNPGRRDGSR